MHYASSVSYQALARAVYVLSGTIAFVVLARVLGPAPLGSYVYAVNLINIGIAIADLGSTGILARDLVASGGSRPVYLANFVALRMLLASAVGIAAIPVALAVAPNNLQLILLLGCLMMPLLAARFFDPVFQVVGRPWLSLWHTGGYGLFHVVGSVAIAVRVTDPVPWLVIAHIFGASAYGIVGLVLTMRLLPPDIRGITRAGLRDVTISIGPLGLGALFGMLAARLDVFLIAKLGTDAMVGQYNAAFRFIDLGVALMVTVLMPLVTVFAHLGVSNRAELVGAFKAMMRFIATWCTALAVLAPTVSPLIVRLLYGDAFASTAPTLDLLAWKFQIAFCSLLCFAMLMTVASIRFSWWNALQSLLLNLALNVLMIPMLGIEGSAIASIISELSLAAVNVFFLVRSMGNVFEPRWWLRLIAATAAAAIVVRLPVGPDPLWLLMPGLAAFVAVMHATGGLPGNPLTIIRRAEGAASPISALSAAYRP